MKCLGILLTGMMIAATHLMAGIIRVPQDQATVQEGIDAAVPGDTVLLASGIYHEKLAIKKSISLASNFILTGDTSFIRTTAIDGDGGTAIEIKNLPDDQAAIVGLTIQNSDDGISTKSKFRLIHNRIIRCKDGVDYEQDSGGICRHNVFELNKDDGIDLDYNVDILIEKNLIQNNKDDGIEIRLQEYSGPRLNYYIRENYIIGNGEDGIQIIDYPDLSNRVFYIERNYIINSAMAGIGCMGDGNTKENYEGASIPERIFVIGNTLVGNEYGITGGDAMVVVNSLVAQTRSTAMKNIDGKSIISFCAFWQNGVNLQNCNQDNANLFFNDPLLDSEYRLQQGSAYVDQGTELFVWQGDTLVQIAPSSFYGSAPDIGAFEYGFAVGIGDFGRPQEEFALLPNYPNPFNNVTTIPVILESSSYVELYIFNPIGQKVKTLFNGYKPADAYFFSWDGRDDLKKPLPSNIYLCEFLAGDFIDVRKMILVR